MTDPVGPASANLAGPGRDVIARVVAPGAAAADADGVPRETIDALARAGLLGDALSPEQQREAAELLAGSDASTWFCWVQHQTPLRALAGQLPGQQVEGSPALREHLLPDLRAGRQLAAVAFAHLRRPGAPNPVATRVGDGWLIDGTLDWVTSWDIADVVLVMASDAAGGQVVCAFLPGGRGRPTPGLDIGEPLGLLAMSGTHTRPLRLERVHVPDEQVGAVLDRRTWAAADARRSADANPAAFGLVRGALAELSGLAETRADEALAGLVGDLVTECRSSRAAAYALAAADREEDIETRLAVRAASLDLAMRATQAVVVARAGGAMRRGCAAQRRLREAAFLLVQAQTAATRGASLRLLARRPEAVTGTTSRTRD